MTKEQKIRFLQMGGDIEETPKNGCLSIIIAVFILAAATIIV